MGWSRDNVPVMLKVGDMLSYDDMRGPMIVNGEGRGRGDRVSDDCGAG